MSEPHSYFCFICNTCLPDHCTTAVGMYILVFIVIVIILYFIIYYLTGKSRPFSIPSCYLAVNRLRTYKVLWSYTVISIIWLSFHWEPQTGKQDTMINISTVSFSEYVILQKTWETQVQEENVPKVVSSLVLQGSDHTSIHSMP